MTTEHSTISDPQIHEPKDVSSANSGEIYVADGAASGAWSKVPVGSISSGAATAGQTYIADGAGAGAFKDGPNIHGEMLVQSYTTLFAVPLAADATLNTDSDYVKITASGMWSAGHLDGVTFNVDELVVPTTGSYEITFWASLEVATALSLVGVKYAINDVTPYSTRKILSKSKDAADVKNVFGSGLIDTLTAGDTISLYVASDKATNLIGREAGLLIKLLAAS